MLERILDEARPLLQVRTLAPLGVQGHLLHPAGKNAEVDLERAVVS